MPFLTYDPLPQCLQQSPLTPLLLAQGHPRGSRGYLSNVKCLCFGLSKLGKHVAFIDRGDDRKAGHRSFLTKGGRVLIHIAVQKRNRISLQGQLRTKEDRKGRLSTSALCARDRDCCHVSSCTPLQNTSCTSITLSILYYGNSAFY